MSHPYVVVVICSYDARFLLFLAHIWIRSVGWIHGWLFKVTLLETWWWVLSYIMIGCFICWMMQIFKIDDTWFMQIWMAMVFLTYDRMWMILYIQNSVQKDELIRTYLDDSCSNTRCWLLMTDAMEQIIQCCYWCLSWSYLGVWYLL